MANPRYNSYKLDMLSPEAKKILADVLIEMGYRDRFVIENGHLSINSNASVVERVFHRAEAKAKGEEGHLIRLRQCTHSSIWIPESEAPTLKEAYYAALQHVENVWPVDQDPETSVGAAEDFGYRREWELEYM